MSKALSQRETQVLALARAGHSTKEIASELGISTSTVNWHRKLAMARQTAAPSIRQTARQIGAQMTIEASSCAAAAVRVSSAPARSRFHTAWMAAAPSASSSASTGTD